ncbi:baseplate J/gp47 family protein [Chitiniphilus purpureus]|uniref:Baseplate J/gp47 family protein n=1 Tax=Chitiniphilus purpureus TaxID=2981137 RepID=A0ABY6DQT9_9NEIS|nr:baseplate J/gp47 family protein [Chitiniphilus sp. CD1]UXY16726.1 baseplate J/gp47 family protein [Chitiniphilus sp. CD1]
MLDLSQLPPPRFAVVPDFEAVYAERKAAFLALLPAESRDAVAAVLALESEPMAVMLQESAYRELYWIQRMNESGLATLLAYAQGADLDQVLARFGVPRLVIQPAQPNAVPPVPEVRESDAAYRERGQRAFDRLSVAGPRAAYVYHALSADGRVADVSAISPSPCVVVVSVLAREGDGAAPSDLLDVVQAALNDEDVRPLGDRLTVQSVEVVPYQVQAVLHLYPGPEAEPILAAANARLADYVADQRRVGRDVRRSALYAALHVSGVQRVDLIQPAADVVLSAEQAAHCTATAISLGAPDE